ncbi:hypothetical protein ZIOFF_025298 [Zingiber officinale]|uniref:Sulfite exporter TauE/SafE family protein n=1 Tax=Zingiber officinale TaxID=94328 RepID=A0A8J5LJQ3_ZINOF|nr:hypothetical protein ZIOFF_025298 [Zingiber officinale]
MLVSFGVQDRGERGRSEESWRWNGNGRGLWRCSDSFASALLVSLAMVSSDRSLGIEVLRDLKIAQEENAESNYVSKMFHFLWQNDTNSYNPVWPANLFYHLSAFGSVGGVGGGGIFVPMLALIIGFDPKSATAISKHDYGCSWSTVYYNLKLRHSSLDMPVIDYGLALLLQPMLVLGIIIGAIFNVIFPDWLATVLLIVLFLGKLTFNEAAKHLVPSEDKDIEYEPLPTAPSNNEQKGARMTEEVEVPFLQNIYWKELGLLVFVWISFLVLQITELHVYMFDMVLDIKLPTVTLYEAIGIYRGDKVITSRGVRGLNLKVSQLLVYCSSEIVGGIVGGLLGLGGGFILGPLFLELGIPRQVILVAFMITLAISFMSAIATFAMLNYENFAATYFVLVATVAGFAGQHVVSRLILLIGRASLIIFILASMIFISAITLGTGLIGGSSKKQTGAAGIASVSSLESVGVRSYDAGVGRSAAISGMEVELSPRSDVGSAAGASVEICYMGVVD